jgi:hypothetical protein
LAVRQWGAMLAVMPPSWASPLQQWGCVSLDAACSCGSELARDEAAILFSDVIDNV